MHQRIRSSSRVLIDAVRKKNRTAVRTLVENGTDIDSVDYDGNCALHHAIFAHDVEIVRLLLKHGAHVDATNKAGMRPYNLAVELKDYPCINILLQFNARINIDDLDFVLKEFPEKTVDVFYKYVDVEDVGFLGYTALHQSVKFDDLNGVRKLLMKGADVNRPTSYEGYMPLHLAKSSKCVELLLRKGAEPNLKDKYECSPLYNMAVKEKCTSNYGIQRIEQARIIEILFANGADGVDVIFAGQIALDYGKDWDSMEGFRDVLRYMAMLEDKHRYTANIDLRLNDKTSVLSHFYRKCLAEIELLREKFIFNNVTFYDFAIKSTKELSIYVCNEKVMDYFKNDQLQHQVQFPIYWDILKRHFDDAVERRTLWELATTSLSSCIKVVDSNHIVTQKILGLLHIDDLENLVLALKMKSALNKL